MTSELSSKECSNLARKVIKSGKTRKNSKKAKRLAEPEQNAVQEENFGASL